MILNSTHTEKNHKQIIADLVGKPYSFFEAIKLKGIGSKRMIVSEVSPNLRVLMNKVTDVNYANIELRRGGIIVYINKGLQNFSWIIPFYQLVIYRTNGMSIHAQGKFIHFKNNKTFKENKQFFSKLLDLKVAYDVQHNLYPI
ncbi:hypothetical protein [Hanstruepera flava]|uniref:hypothetical protein n=1 Tax=Hanstruepera flava TaxID=2930218 RepID=UPI002027AEDF|nr:hypothetical protein [Hanstruepera flava]